MFRRRAIRCFLLPLLVATACAESRRGGSPPPEVTDDVGGHLSLERQPRRVVSLVPSLTEVVVALGGEGRLVARSRYDRDPRLSDLPSIGGALRPNLEALAALKPDLVIAWADRGEQATGSRLSGLGIPVYQAETQTLGDLRRHVSNLGRLLGLQGQAEELLRRIDDSLAAVASWVAGAKRPSVLYVVWHDPPQTAGPDTFIDSIITVAGGWNLFSDIPVRWPRISLEEIVRRDPDVVVLAARHDGEPEDVGWIRRAPGWRDLRAVRDGRVLVVSADLFNRPGPHVWKAARQLAGFLHPTALPEAVPR